MAGQGERGRAAADLIRQLASAYASYRLFPGDTEQPGFQAAVARVQTAATTVLAAGAFNVDIRSGVFRTQAGDVPGDETIDRFAMACFERRVEHLHVTAVPDAHDLASLGEVLTLPIDELEGVRAALSARGVSSIRVGEVTPGSSDELGVDTEDLTPDQLAMWERLQDPGSLAASLIVEGLAPDIATAAQDLYRRFRTLNAVLPEELTARRDFFVRIRQVLQELPHGVQREFMATVMSRIAADDFASSFAVNLTDAELAELLIELARHGGPDPIELGKRVVAMTDRKQEVLDLVAARLTETGDVREMLRDVRPTMLALSKPEDETQIRQVIADQLSEGLVEATSLDASYVRELYPSTPVDERTLAFLALRDYLAVEDQRVSLERVLERWSDGTRAAAGRGDLALVDRLLDVVADLRADSGNVFKRDAVARAIASVPTPELVGELLEGARQALDVSVPRTILERFGGASLDAVLDLLATEGDRSVRAQLVALAAGLGRGEVDTFADRMDDPRWYVVRNMVTILGRGAGRDALPVLVRVVGHPDPTVRREVVRSLVACAGSDAAPYLRRLAGDGDPSVRQAALGALTGLGADVAARALADVVRTSHHLDDRRRALEALATHPSEETVPLLRDLASRRARPRIPRALRKQARKLARAKERSGT